VDIRPRDAAQGHTRKRAALNDGGHPYSSCGEYMLAKKAKMRNKKRGGGTERTDAPGGPKKKRELAYRGEGEGTLLFSKRSFRS